MTNKKSMKKLTGLDKLQPFFSDELPKNSKKKHYPLEKWQPNEFGNMDLTIKANGEWWHEGGEMTRESLVTLFSSLLWCEEKNSQKTYYLKTPVEQLKIIVEDAPLLITDVNLVKKNTHTTHIESEDNDRSQDILNNFSQLLIKFTTNTEDTVVLNSEHLIYFANYQDDVRPYIRVRDNLHALISRSVFYHLLEIGQLHEKKGQTILSLNSGGELFHITVDE